MVFFHVVEKQLKPTGVGLFFLWGLVGGIVSVGRVLEAVMSRWRLELQCYVRDGVRGMMLLCMWRV